MEKSQKHLFVSIWTIYDHKVCISKSLAEAQEESTHLLGNVKTGQDKSQVGSFLPITTKRLMKNIVDIKQSFLLTSVTWEFGACGLNNVLPTMGMTAEVWRDGWAD